MSNRKIDVYFFQRKPRQGFSFSLEFIFEDVRRRLSSNINASVLISRCYNNGYLSKLVNILEAAIRQGDTVNHITGEVHFLDLLMKKSRVVLTIHDCGMIHRKTGFAKMIVKWLYLSGPVRRASIVTAVSEKTKREIIEYTGCDAKKIRVVPVAVDPKYMPMPKVFNKTNPTILQIGTGYNKNLLGLIDALKNLPCTLIIIGKLSNEQLMALSNNKITYRNEYNVPSERLLEVYHECDILSFVSTFEGFGMPIIEANAVERVVVSSNLSSMPEVANNAACLVDPFDVLSIRSGIEKVINDDLYREQLINNGRINKLRFEPQSIADLYLDIYMEVAEHGR